jgi:putative YphP/YqiW family bacilliredoxin
MIRLIQLKGCTTRLFPDSFGVYRHRPETKFPKRGNFTAIISYCGFLSQLSEHFLYFCPLLKYTRMYPEEIVIPMKEELTENGFTELLSSSEVESQLAKEGTTLVMINSVCGCSAGTARPGVLLAVANAVQKPDYLTTSFAGFDVDAIRTLRQHLMPYPPSSPAIALFKNGQLVHFIERHQIEGRPAQVIAQNLIGAFDQHCN